MFLQVIMWFQQCLIKIITAFQVLAIQIVGHGKIEFRDSDLWMFLKFNETRVGASTKPGLCTTS